MQTEEWRAEARRRLDALASAYAAVASAAWDGDVWRWHPHREGASGVVVLVEDPWTLTVCFGWDAGRVELGYTTVDHAEQLDELVAICRAVAAGGLREELTPGGGCRWWLRLEGGSTISGRAGPRRSARRGGGGAGATCGPRVAYDAEPVM